MWVIFNPTAEDLSYDIDFKKWHLKAGEAKKFPNEVASQMKVLHGFLQVLERDDQAPKITYKPPKSLKSVKEAIPEDLQRDERKMVHPSSDPKVKETGGFSGTMSDEQAGLPKTYKKRGESGELINLDKDGVEWYGGGIEVDNPLSKD